MEDSVPMTEKVDADWFEWHRRYDDPGSSLSRRLAIVQEHIREALDRRRAATRIISVCAGQGRNLIGVLEAHPQRNDVKALLVELDERNVEVARAAASDAGLQRVDVKRADAGISDSYQGGAPADIVLACGVFGNISNEEVVRTIDFLPSLCAEGATVIWTRGREMDADVALLIRGWFSEREFEEVVFHAPADADVRFRVGVHRFAGVPRPLERGVRLFEFVD